MTISDANAELAKWRNILTIISGERVAWRNVSTNASAGTHNRDLLLLCPASSVELRLTSYNESVLAILIDVELLDTDGSTIISTVSDISFPAGATTRDITFTFSAIGRTVRIPRVANLQHIEIEQRC